MMEGRERLDSGHTRKSIAELTFADFLSHKSTEISLESEKLLRLVKFKRTETRKSDQVVAFINDYEGYIAQNNGHMHRFKFDPVSNSLQEKVITEQSNIIEVRLLFLGASLRDLIWYETKNFGFFYNFSEKTTYIIDLSNSYKAFYSADLCGYFGKILRKDPEDNHLFALTAKAQISVLLNVSING